MKFSSLHHRVTWPSLFKGFEKQKGNKQTTILQLQIWTKFLASLNVAFNQTGFLELSYPHSHICIPGYLFWIELNFTLNLESVPPLRGISLCTPVSDSPAPLPKGAKPFFLWSDRMHLPQIKVLALSHAILRLIQQILFCHPFQSFFWFFSTLTFSSLTPPTFNLCATSHSVDWCNLFTILKGSTKKSNFP